MDTESIIKYQWELKNLTNNASHLLKVFGAQPNSKMRKFPK